MGKVQVVYWFILWKAIVFVYDHTAVVYFLPWARTPARLHATASAEKVCDLFVYVVPRIERRTRSSTGCFDYSSFIDQPYASAVNINGGDWQD